MLFTLSIRPSASGPPASNPSTCSDTPAGQFGLDLRDHKIYKLLGYFG